jgi:hypothetical protein
VGGVQKIVGELGVAAAAADDDDNYDDYDE